MTAVFSDPPATAAWEHRDARNGFEVVLLSAAAGGYRIEGVTAAVEDGQAWIVEYAITLDRDWQTKAARVQARGESGRRELHLAAEGAGRWIANGAAARAVDGCLDVDLESSSLTNAFPVRRLGLEVGGHAEAPAVYVRAPGLAVERLEQRYARMPSDGDRQRYRYSSPAFGFETELVYDAGGLVLDYPGIAARVA